MCYNSLLYWATSVEHPHFTSSGFQADGDLDWWHEDRVGMHTIQNWDMPVLWLGHDPTANWRAWECDMCIAEFSCKQKQQENKMLHCEWDHALQCAGLIFIKMWHFHLVSTHGSEFTLLTSHFPYFHFPNSLFLVGMHSLRNCWKSSHAWLQRSNGLLVCLCQGPARKLWKRQVSLRQQSHEIWQVGVVGLSWCSFLLTFNI